MKKLHKNLLIYSAILILLVLLVIWLNNNCFFLCFDNSDFSNLLTPIIALFSVILLIITLSASQTYNSRQLSINEYNILLQDFEILKTTIESLTFNLTTNGFSQNFTNQVKKSDGINYITLFSQFYYFELSNDQEKNEKIIAQFRNEVIFPLIRNYKNLGIFINEVIQNDILSDRYKNKFYLKVEQQLLQDYLRICNNIDSNGTVNYDLKLLESNVYKTYEFMEVNELYIKYSLFQINDLPFYRETL